LLEFCHAGQKVIGFDIDSVKVDALNNGHSYISYIESKTIEQYHSAGLFEATTDFSRLNEAAHVIVAVPTPLDEHREPDLSFVKNSAEIIAKHLVKGQLIVLESTTYPGTTREIILPLLEQRNLKVGEDYYLAYSPERVDPNNIAFSARQIPKVVGGLTPACLEQVKVLYQKVFEQVVPVSSPEIAEASKLLENIFRSVNIALVNELKMLFDRMDIDIWQVIKASSTKPFGFMPFYPGPGLGGHCIPIDPFYLTWKAREYDFSTRFIELAGEINSQMPYYVVSKVVDTLNNCGVSINGARILILGAAYKKDVDDIRESPAVKIINLLQSKGAAVTYHDPYIPVIKEMRRYPGFEMKSAPLDQKLLMAQDCLLVITDHNCFDYPLIYKNSKLIVDTRNAFNHFDSVKIVKA
jgi:UDP-N-acetyl-D-glucosamine dehydrogenase